MSEQDFKDALRRTMDAVTPPPPMSDAPVLEAAHRDRRRRRTMWASAGTATVVAAIAVGVVLVAPSTSGGDGPQVGGPAAPKPTQDVSTSPAEPSPRETVVSPGKSEETLPPGMTDRTQRSGPHYERGAELTVALDEVLAAAGFGTPGDLEGNGELADAELKRNQANFDGEVDGVEKWTYSAYTPVTRGGGVGEMTVDVSTTTEQASGCALTSAQSVQGQCREVVVDGKKVAVTDVNDPAQEHVDQVAAYRHDDGTVVYVSQSIDYGFTDHPPLAALPFTPEQLAALAVDPRFKVTG
jgi:hypothetical protein